MAYENTDQRGNYRVATDANKNTRKKLSMEKILGEQNLAERLDPRDLGEIGDTVLTEYKADKESRSGWEKANKAALDLAMQATSVKNTPWQNASNVKYPLLTIAGIQFASRVYPMIVTGRNVAKCAINGADPQGAKAARASRVSAHLNYQILSSMEDWEEDMDRLLHMLPVTGVVFKKTYRDVVTGKNVSELILPEDFVVSYYTKSLSDGTRCTHVYSLSKNEFVEKVRSGVFSDVELGEPEGDGGGQRVDSDTPYRILEQHRLLDLDGDGYAEPYIVSVHEVSGKVLNILPRFAEGDIEYTDKEEIKRISADNFFTKYGFIPSPDGGYYDIAFGQLLGPLNRSVNTLINQLIDAGTLSNMQGGFIGKGIKLSGGQLRFNPGEWKRTDSVGSDLRNSIVPLPAADPSSVLFSMLGMLVQAGERLSSITDPMAGESIGSRAPAATTMALIEQGMKVFTSVGKRLHRSLKQELTKLARLNALYMEDSEYYQLLDVDQSQMGGDGMGVGQVYNIDYNMNDLDISPYSDPSAINDAGKIMKMQALREMAQMPDANPRAILEYSIETLGIEGGKEKFMKPPQQGPSPEQLAQLAELENETLKLKIRMFEAKAKSLELASRTVKHMTDVEMDTPDAEYSDAVEKFATLKQGVEQDAARDFGEGVQGMEGQPGNEGGPQGAGGDGGPPQGQPM